MHPLPQFWYANPLKSEVYPRISQVVSYCEQCDICQNKNKIPYHR